MSPAQAADESLLCLGDDIAAGSDSDGESFTSSTSGFSGAESNEDVACPDEQNRGDIHSSKTVLE